MQRLILAIDGAAGRKRSPLCAPSQESDADCDALLNARAPTHHPVTHRRAANGLLRHIFLGVHVSVVAISMYRDDVAATMIAA